MMRAMHILYSQCLVIPAKTGFCFGLTNPNRDQGSIHQMKELEKRNDLVYGTLCQLPLVGLYEPKTKQPLFS